MKFVEIYFRVTRGKILLKMVLSIKSTLLRGFPLYEWLHCQTAFSSDQRETITYWICRIKYVFECFAIYELKMYEWLEREILLTMILLIKNTSSRELSWQSTCHCISITLRGEETSIYKLHKLRNKYAWWKTDFSQSLYIYWFSNTKLSNDHWIR